MSTWPMRPLGEVGEFVRGITFKPSNLVVFDAPYGVACFRTTNIQDILEDDDLIFVPRDIVRNGQQWVQAGDILISTANSNNLVGKCCFVPELEYEATLGGFISAYRSQERVVNRKYAYYWFASPPSQVRFRRIANQTTNISNLRVTDVAKELIPVPPLAEQERIVRILDEANAIRKLRAQADQRTADLIPALFHEMFGDPAINPMGWPMQPLSEVIAGLQGGRNVNPAAEGEPGGQYRVLKVSAVTSGRFSPAESKPVPAAYEPPESHLVRQGDVLFSRANTTELVGATCCVPTEPCNVLLPDKIWRLVWKQESLVDPLYILHLLQSKQIRVELSRRASGTGGSMKNISQPKLLSLPIPIPPLSIQRDFAERVVSMHQLQQSQRLSEQTTGMVFETMLSQAFSGGLL